MPSMVIVEAKATSESALLERAARQAADAEASQRNAQTIRCAACGTPLALASDAMVVAGHHEHSFINPQGYIFRIRCFTSVRNVLTFGEPSSDFTWFPGHTWVVLNCAVCGFHVGWRFDAASVRFYALVADRISDDVVGEA